ncbi:DUF5805 domain-containing protein [Halobacterium salinarum]|uniref:DUF5805 domain-containing protein n=1 Tax=Halobacterium salinarum TaxID=2242 RepID=UPI002552A4BA|nr:DUF5805 domain-containing protein [Halobacterium salinarum]MDL0126685.1 DUF5805 domain-containing protein [Halobacterium salinarum]MDL0133232.1 DUF5805 domain-containing protein [Halobacterium salinarum]
MGDTDRAVVKTYVPADQKATWQDHAERLDMTQSEFLRTMVQAGRRGFLDDSPDGGSSDATPRGDALEDRVQSMVDEGDAVSWDELVTQLAGDFEDRIDTAVQSLADDGVIRFDPRRGGYVSQADE